MQHTRLWSRVGHWFKRTDVQSKANPLHQGKKPTTQTVDSGLDVVGLTPSAPNEPVVPSGLSTLDSKLRLTRSTPTMDKLAEEFRRVVDLMDTLKQHMADQQQRSERTARSLERLTELMQPLSDSSTKQIELLSTISRSVESHATTTKRLAEELSHIPNLIDAQRESMVSIGHHLQASNGATSKVGEAIVDLHQVIGTLSDATQTTTQNIEHMRAEAASRELRSAELLAQQMKRFSLIAWIGVSLVALLSAFALVALFIG